MSFNPNMNPKHDAETSPPDRRPGAVRRSSIEFGPGLFSKGFEWLVYMVVHELDHVAQNLIGTYRQAGDEHPVMEFLAYSAAIRQVGPTPGRPAGPGRPGVGLLAELGAPTQTPTLPPLPPGFLAGEAAHALEYWMKMTAEEKPGTGRSSRGRGTSCSPGSAARPPGDCDRPRQTGPARRSPGGVTVCPTSLTR